VEDGLSKTIGFMKKTAIALSSSQKKRLASALDRFGQARILVLGDFILDQFVWGSVKRISPEAPVPVVNVERESFMPGGSLNVAHNITTLGGTVYPCGVVGRDLAGRMLLKSMRKEGIETAGVIYDRDRPTSLKTRIIAHSQQVVRFDREKTHAISKEDQQGMLKFLKKKIPSVDVVIIEDYGKGVIQPELVSEVVRSARKHGKPILVDPKEKHFDYYRGVTVLTPNRKEAYEAYRTFHPRMEDGLSLETVGFGLIRQIKSDALLVTLGEDGMVLFEKKGKVTSIPTAAREVFDVSGAGDTVIASLALALAAGAELSDAAMLSNLAAGIVVGKLGTATVTLKELKAAVIEA